MFPAIDFEKNWLSIVVLVIIGLIAVKILDLLLARPIYYITKSLCCYRTALANAKLHLEEDYNTECWADDEFCRAYLLCYERFKLMRNILTHAYDGSPTGGDEEFSVDVRIRDIRSNLGEINVEPGQKE